MALVLERILSGEFKGMHDYVDTETDKYYALAFINDEINASVLEEWKRGVLHPSMQSEKASERDYETEVIKILSPIEITVGEGK